MKVPTLRKQPDLYLLDRIAEVVDPWSTVARKAYEELVRRLKARKA